MIVGCKQDLERVELPYVEIEAMVTIIKMKKILLILLVIRRNITLSLLIIDLQVSLDWECGYTECSSLDGTGVTGVFRFNFFLAYLAGNWELFVLGIFGKYLRALKGLRYLINFPKNVRPLCSRELLHQAGVRAPEAFASSRRQ